MKQVSIYGQSMNILELREDGNVPDLELLPRCTPGAFA